MSSLSQLEAEVASIVQSATPEFLPRLFRGLLNSNRPGLISCQRHTFLLAPYVKAQIKLHHVKRTLRHLEEGDTDYCKPSAIRIVKRSVREARCARDEIREVYRSTPCTCWVPHR